MDHLAVFDGFGSTSLDLAPLPASELAHSSSCRPDKGKARARDTADDDVHIVGFHPAGPSRSNRDGNALGFHDLDHRTTTSLASSNSKGKAKAKQQVSDPNPADRCSHPFDPHNDSLDSEYDATSSQSRRSRTPWANAANQLDEADFNASTSHPPFLPEDTSLKRSIRELGSSPSHSPHQHPASLPSLEAHPSTSPSRTNTTAHLTASSSSLSLQPATDIVYARPSTSYKKRRSDRNPAEDQDSLHASDGLSTSNVASSTSQTLVAVEPSRPAVPLRPSSRESLSSLRSNARRASLLVNSSTSATRSLDSDNGSFCVSPEPIDVHTRFSESRHDLSQRRSAFLDDTRAQRSTNTIRRRRGFYLRDADLLRNEPSDDTLPTSDRPNSAASDTSFMADFARAVDLRLGTRTDNMHNYATSPTSELLNRSTQRRPPQLPYVRAASPLTVPIPFAPTDHDNSGQYAAYVRRRADAQSLDRVQQSERNERRGFSSATSHRIAYNPDFSESPPVQSSSRPDGMARTSQNDSYRIETLQGEPNQAHESTSNRADSATATASSTLSEWPDTWRSYQEQSLASTAQNRSSDATSTQDFGAVRRPFGQQGSRATRQSLRSRAQAGGTEARAAAADAEARRSRDWSLQEQSDPASRRQADEMPGQRDSLPWRRTHFGVRTSSHYRERHPSVAAQPRFEPFAEGTSPESRRPPAGPLGSAGSRGSFSTSLRQERSENESALAYLGRLMSHDSMLDEWMAGDVHGPLLRMAIESEVLISNPHFRHLGYPPASTSSMFGRTPHLAFDARNFIADEDWAELNSYEGLMQLSERLGAAEICVPQSLIDTLPTCEYGKWDGGSCRPRGESATPPPSKGKGKQKVEPPATTRDTICPICREDYLDSDMLMSINKCCHAFHADCIKTWFKSAKSCPLCRADAFDEISLPALSFQTSSSASASTSTTRAAAAATAERPTWSLNF